MPSTYFAYSKAIPGSVIPGELQRMSVRTVNFPDFSSAFKVQKKADPVVRFPGMGETHGSSSGAISKLKELLQKGGSRGGGGDDIMRELAKMFGKQGPQTAPGYEEVRENRQWKAV